MEHLNYLGLGERNNNYNNKHVVMETRTFRILPVQRGAEIEVIHTHTSYDYEDDDSLAVSTPNSSVHSRSYNRSFHENRMESHSDRDNRSLSFETVDAREDDEPSPPMVLRSYNRNAHPSPKGIPREVHHYQHGKIPTGIRTGTETEKRIAQLRSAGLLISTKGKGGLPPRSSPQTANPPAFRFSQHNQEGEREPPPRMGSDATLQDVGSRGFPRNKNRSALQALLEKDSKQQYQRVKDLPPSYDSMYQIRRSRRSKTFAVPARPSSVVPKEARLLAQTDAALDPIIAARPSYQGLRVSYQDYPDPEAFGWAFCASCAERRVEWFETHVDGHGIALEFQYTTGTVRATLEDHPLEGNSTLLAFCLGGGKRGLSPKIYKKILMDPLGCGGGCASARSRDKGHITTLASSDHSHSPGANKNRSFREVRRSYHRRFRSSSNGSSSTQYPGSIQPEETSSSMHSQFME